MIAPATYKALRSALTKIKAATALVVHDSQYWNTSAGKSAHPYNQTQGRAALVRKIGRLRGQLKRAKTLSYLCDEKTGQTVRQICDVTPIIIECCDHFPRDAAWPGDKPWSRQLSLIATARNLLKRDEL